MTVPKRTRLCVMMVLILTACLALGAVPAASRTLAGYVADYHGMSDYYELRRDGERVVMSYFTQIYDGDVIRIHGDDTIVLALGPAGETKISLTKKDSPFTVTYKKQAAPSPFDNLLQSLWNTISGRYDYHLADGGVMGPSDPLELPMAGLVDRSAQIGHGEWRLGLAWLGGRPPFELWLANENTGNDLIRQTTQVRSFVSPKPITLPFGFYQLEITDASGQKLTGRFEVVQTDDIPQMPSGLIDPHHPPMVINLMQAAWLSAQEQGKWSFQAYLMALKLRDQTGPAKALSDVLSIGGHP